MLLFKYDQQSDDTHLGCNTKGITFWGKSNVCFLLSQRSNQSSNSSDLSSVKLRESAFDLLFVCSVVNNEGHSVLIFHLFHYLLGGQRMAENVELIKLWNKSKHFHSSFIFRFRVQCLCFWSEESDSFVDFVFSLFEGSLCGSACFLCLLYLLIFVIHELQQVINIISNIIQFIEWFLVRVQKISVVEKQLLLWVYIVCSYCTQQIVQFIDYIGWIDVYILFLRIFKKQIQSFQIHQIQKQIKNIHLFFPLSKLALSLSTRINYFYLISPSIISNPQTHYFYYSCMLCSSKKCRKGDRCQNNHTFSLRATKSDTYYRNSLQLEFCPTLNRDGKVVANSFPVFNNDKKIYTPAFCLDMDKNYTIEQDNQMVLEHMRKVKESLQIRQQILFPKPNHKNKYCSVCKENYEDYLLHIEGPSHKRSIHKSKFNKYIGEICSIFKSQTTAKEDRQETKDELLEEYQRPTIKKTIRADTSIDFEEKVLTQASSTNFSAINFQNSYMYNPFFSSMNLAFSPYYYLANIGRYYPIQFPWQFPDTYCSSNLFPVQFPVSQNHLYKAPILISDDDQ